MFKFKTIVPKNGDINSYINKPLLDKISSDPLESSKVIGIISRVVEVETGYELSITLWKQELVAEFFCDKQLSSLSIGTKNKGDEHWRSK